tara:strand:- start:12701 stop:13336 length:636 start_codon:yes stop_codon:yes gene_type:complete
MIKYNRKEDYVMNSDQDKLILTDCDGVLMNWEYAFGVWMKKMGYAVQVHGTEGSTYDMSLRYGITSKEKSQLIKHFNTSSAIGYLPPLRDAMYYMDLLHRKHGYVFHMITSLSLDPMAQELRESNTRKLFGDTAFEKFIYADVGGDKDEVLAPYTGSGLYWLEDKIENAQLGLDLGLESILIEHGHNMDSEICPKMKNWAQLYEYITGEVA